jgi:hypothetical protein
MGAVLGLGILLVRRHVPESPRWLFIHGREQEAERIVDDIERSVEDETHEPLDEPGDAITVRQRRTIGFGEIARTAFERYPRRTVLGLALFVGQAFLYNAITFDLGTLLNTFFKVSSSAVPLYLALYGVSNFLGPLLLGRLFDTVGRKPMVTLTYAGSAVVTIVLAVLFMNGSLGLWGFMALLLAVFFLASAGASAAYLTVSEIFPMETRALAIAFFYAIGTAIGGITGPLLFSKMIGSGDATQAGIAFLIGAAIMLIGAVAELLFGVRAEQRSLEDIATPLSAEEAERRPARRPAATRRYRPGPAQRGGYSPGMPVSEPAPGVEYGREVERIVQTLEERGPLDRTELARAVGARYWGPGRFAAALREAILSGRVRRVDGRRYAVAGEAPPPPRGRFEREGARTGGEGR